MSIDRVAPLRYGSAAVGDTVEFGGIVADCLMDGDVLVLTGGLGVGKTHFTKGVSAGLGDGHPVTSPTFALMAVHDGGRIPLFHFDLYRLEHAYQLEDTGIFDVLGYEGACLLEWGEQFQDELTDEYRCFTSTCTASSMLISWRTRASSMFWDTRGHACSSGASSSKMS